MEPLNGRPKIRLYRDALKELAAIAHAAEPGEFIRHPFQVLLPTWRGRPLSETLNEILAVLSAGGTPTADVIETIVNIDGTIRKSQELSDLLWSKKGGWIRITVEALDR